jgi:truncated hemoglobin YjbI
MTPTLYERLGGDVGVDAALRVFHDRLLNDPTTELVIDMKAANRTSSSDAARLREVLGANASPEVLFEHFDAVEVHLRDALWLCGVAAPLIDEVIGAVRRAAGTMAG